MAEVAWQVAGAAGPFGGGQSEIWGRHPDAAACRDPRRKSPQTIRSSKALEYQEAAMETGELEIDGVRIAYTRRGKGRRWC